MRKLNLLYLLLIVVVLAILPGCPKNIHVEGVAPEKQSIELFARNTGETIKAIEKTRKSLLVAAYDLHEAKEISESDYQTILRVSEKYDVAFKVAGAALDELRKSIDEGKTTSTTAVDTAIAGLKEALANLEELF